MPDELTVGQMYVKHWRDTWEPILADICEGTTLTRSEAMLYMVWRDTNGVGRLLADFLDTDDDWKRTDA